MQTTGMAGVMLAMLALPLVQASWSYGGAQGLGFCVVLLALARDAGLRHELWRSFRGQFNTNPFLAGVVAGVVAHHEARGEPDGARLSGPLQTSLAAVGDVFFWRTLRPGLSVAAVASAGFVSVLGPLVLLVPFAVAGQGTRCLGLVAGLARGKDAALRLAGGLSRLNTIMLPVCAALSGFLCVRAIVAGPWLTVMASGVAAWLLFGFRRMGAWLLPLALLALVVVRVVV